MGTDVIKALMYNIEISGRPGRVGGRRPLIEASSTQQRAIQRILAIQEPWKGQLGNLEAEGWLCARSYEKEDMWMMPT